MKPSVELQQVREGEDHAAAIAELLEVASAHDDHKALGEHKWLDLVHGGRRGVVGYVAREPGHGHVVGYVHLSRNDSGPHPHWGMEMVVHPEHRGVGIELALARRALDTVAESGGGHLHFWVFRPGDIHEGLAHQLDLTRGRELLQMRCRLGEVPEPRWPQGVTVRTFRPEDADDWLRVNNRAFRHHPEQGAWDRRTLDERMREDWFDPEGLLLAFDERGLAGSCWTKVHAGESVGEIYVIGVDPDREGMGLGKALVLGGMRLLQDRGLNTVMLYVDGSNDRAVGLYERLGYTVHHVDRAYVTDIAPA